MHFDDRLATVLRLPTSSEAIARIQFRQLVDLLGQKPDPDAALSAALVDAALARLEHLGTLIGADARARILREPSTRLANPELVARLATAEPEIASAAISAADLSESDWLELIPSLPVRARGILRHRRGFGPLVEALLERLGIGDRALPPAATPATPTGRPELTVIDGGDAPAAPTRPTPGGGIGQIVRRIEAFRRARDGSGEPSGENRPSEQPALAPHLRLATLDILTDSEGRVTWADGDAATAIVGWPLAEVEPRSAENPVREAIERRQPISGCMIHLPLAPAVAGEWRLDAVPCFEGGRYVGHAGRLRRPSSLAAPTAQAVDEADRMRQILHELRTPANAIQVAAEIIQQQLYGPAPHEYRALAAAIAGDTAQVLAGFDELDRLVRLESGLLTPTRGECDLGALISDTVARLHTWSRARGSGFALPQPMPPLPVGMDREEAARLCWRLLAGLAAAAEPGEVLPLSVEEAGKRIHVVIMLPRRLAERTDDARQTAPTPDAARSLSVGMFGTDFTMRLTAAEVAAMGGSLERNGASLHLRLPGLTPEAPSHTQSS